MISQPDSDGHPSQWLGCVIFLAATLMAPAARSVEPSGKEEHSKAASTQSVPSNAVPRLTTSRGRELARQHCASCHLFPEPALLPKTAWLHHVLPEMATWLGLEPFDDEGQPEGRLLREANLYPMEPRLTDEDWLAIWDYYRESAPMLPVAAPPRAPARKELKNFRIKRFQFHSGAPMTCLVKIVPEEKRLYVGDAFAGLFAALNPAGQVLFSLRLPSGPVSLREAKTGFYLTLIGRIYPSDALEGGLTFIPRSKERLDSMPILTGLRRPADAAVGDLNGDGRDDLIVCAYGNRLGRLSWFEDTGAGRYEEHILLERPGTFRVEVSDFNRDGRPDVLVAVAQAREGIYLMMNEGDNLFRPVPVAEFPPTFGLAGLELADFNNDARPDLLVANGDLGDYPAPANGAHGIRLYMNDGVGHFREALFFPLAGAYKAVARDFDLDGDLDIAAMAHYPNFAEAPEEGFVYLENKGGLRFEAATAPELAGIGRWLVMDAGDLDADGDADIALGSFLRGPTTVPVPLALRNQWRTNSAAVVMLENLAK